jgi:hypothetical protein
MRKEYGRAGGSHRGQHRRGGRDRRLSVRGELRREPDVHKIARAVIALAMAQAEADAEAAANADNTAPARTDQGHDAASEDATNE